MNNRVRKKRYKKNILLQTQSIKPMVGDYIVVKYPKREFTCVELLNIGKIIQSKFKNNKVFCIPDELSIETMSKEGFSMMIENLNEYRL